MRSAVLCLVLAGLLWASPTAAKTLEELRADLDARREQVREAEKHIQQYQADIQVKKKEARTLSQQITLLDGSIRELELTLERTVAEIEKTSAEIDEVVAEIALREEEIARQKVALAEYIRNLHTHEQQSLVTIFLKYSTFSAAVNEAAVLSELQVRGQETLVAIKQLRDELKVKQRELEDFKQTLDALKARQEQQQATLSAQRTAKARILELTNQQEKQFQELLQAARATHEAAEADISRLDSLIREELKRQGIGELPSVGVLDWPIASEFGVSCEFHCPDYPYQHLIGPHSGIDIPAYVGTPVRAAAEGYVARVHDAQGPGYSYILLIHGGSISTVYGHLSGFATSEGDVVTRGAAIGYSGGAPGMRGAGLSSGPHLHFEVREKNHPVNPRRYL